MKDSILTIIKNTFTFRGVCSRKDYWTYFFVVFIVINFIFVSIIFGLIEAENWKASIVKPTGLVFLDARSIVYDVFFLPLISATVRRLRDAGLSPWLVFIPYVNLILCTRKSK